MGACGSANSVAVVKAQPAAPKPKFRGHRLQDVPLSPCASWQGPDLGARISRPDRSLHDEHVQRLEHFLECVEQQPKALDKLITRRRRAAKARVWNRVTFKEANSFPKNVAKGSSSRRLEHFSRCFRAQEARRP
ncbi:unnamed protein product [Effrenium voratum]|nr:unnamed protein product [Effrenium voratum]